MSPCLIRRLTPAGLQPVTYQAGSLAEAERFEPYDGVYTVANTFQVYKVLKLDAHLDRLEDSARRVNIPLRLDRGRLRAALREMIAQSGFGDVRFRVTVAREHPDQLLLAIEPFQPPAPELYTQGVRCITIPNSARHDPATKTTGWLHERERFALPEGVYTALLLDSEGHILEGLSSNFYAVRAGELWTAGAGVLPGIAQQIVLEIAPPILPVRREAVLAADLPSLEEAFITSSSRGILPVIAIDAVTIGDGRPGKHTRALRAAYLDWVAAHLEDL